MPASNLASGVVSCALFCAVQMLALPAMAQNKYNLGQPLTAEQIKAWNIDVFPDGRNLPAARGTVARGKVVFEAQCAACHGMKGEGGLYDRLAGGMGTLASPKPVRTVGSFWPYASTLFDYVRRAMPLNAPQSLSDEDVYSVSGYVLFLNGLLPESATVDAATISSLKMPNRDGFVPDSRPDVKTKVCTRDCTK